MSSLDDFFAKKDKKKGKDKGKSVLTPDALVKELEEGASKQPEYHTRKENKTSGVGIEILGLGADDADWKDFEDVDKRDYTGLKIQTMSLEDQEEELRRIQAAERRDTDQDIAWKPTTPAVSTSIPNAAHGGEMSNPQTNQEDGNTASKKNEQSDSVPAAGSDAGSNTSDPAGSRTESSTTANSSSSEQKVPAPYVCPSLARAREMEAAPLPGSQRTRTLGKGGRWGQTNTIDLSSDEAFPTLS